MGCGASSPAAVAAPNNVDTAKLKREKASTGGTEAMVDASATNIDNHAVTPATSVQVGDLALRYAAHTRRGRDPDRPSKPNQDCYGHHTNKASAFFAVYDGHGPAGEHCSRFVKGRLPQLLKEHITQRGFAAHSTAEPLSVQDIHASLHEAHVGVNDEMRQSTSVDDLHSGTTSVGVFVHDRKLTVANVGDSRIVLGTAGGGSAATKVQAVPLSKDHTPYRPDEAQRCISQGARILSFGEIDPSTFDADIEDPPRVWARNGDYPGTAFTRSIGDAVAETLGVYAEPELTTLPISPDERLLVLASDGVFDVVSNQAVVDTCFRFRNDPAAACKALLEQSHREWLLNDDCGEDRANYDDMTCVVIYFDHPTHGGADAGAAPQAQQREEEGPRRHGKRVRQKTLQNLAAMEE